MTRLAQAYIKSTYGGLHLVFCLIYFVRKPTARQAEEYANFLAAGPGKDGRRDVEMGKGERTKFSSFFLVQASIHQIH